MGQLVSSSSVVEEVVAGGGLRRPYFVENRGCFVPVVSRGVAYEVQLKRDGGDVVCTLESEQGRVEMVLQQGGEPRRYTFRLDERCESGFYRLRCLDIDAEVFVEGVKGGRDLLEGEMSGVGDVWLPDGAEFRNLIGSLEDSVVSLQKSGRWKSLLETLLKFHDLLRSLSSVCDTLAGIKVKFANDRDHPLKRLFNEDFHSWVQSFNEKHVVEVCQSVGRDVIVPLQEFLEFEKQNMKLLPRKQKNFNEAVRLMYSSQSSLSLSSKVQYELARLEYQNFLNKCYVMGPPLRKLYTGVSFFLQTGTQERIAQFDDSYMKRNLQLRTSIKNAQSLSDLTKLYSSVNTPHMETQMWVDFQENDTGSGNANVGSSNGNGGPHGSHWHRKWVILDGHQLSIFHLSKKSAVHTVDLSFACIKQINKSTLEILTSGSLQSLPALAAVSSSSSSVEHNSLNSKNHRSKVFLQLKDQTEADHWFAILKKANLDTKQYSNSAATDEEYSPAATSLIDLVINQHKSNSFCCDCGDSQTVEWISINLLCVLCIKCSGVHRSMGSHISKVRSLTLDSFTSPEILHLLRNNVSNANVNSIYEANQTKEAKITLESSNAERSQYIINKYQARRMVNDGVQDPKTSLKSLIKAIHLNSIYLLQKTVAQSKLPLRDVINEQSKSDGSEEQPTVFQYSLKHHEMSHGKPVFFITEFLLYNGLPVDKVPVDVSNWSPTVIEYWRNKVEVYGVFSPTAYKPKSHENNDSLLPPLTIPTEKPPNRRWTLNHMPSSPQIKSPTNILNMHKSLKLSKRGNGTRKD